MTYRIQWVKEQSKCDSDTNHEERTDEHDLTYVPEEDSSNSNDIDIIWQRASLGDAVNGPKREQWLNTISEEIGGKPVNKTVVKCKLILKKKVNSEGEVK
ncbi:unnamed protein product [Parnassius apollo]|uniref:(apollo) hypothetical protein n=1 Tax=Parnassius apollo TaxID=110799 RepID=A0A8S3W2S6_PARAO|nr:unnamed protein product [Parnassius apollo]